MQLYINITCISCITCDETDNKLYIDTCVSTRNEIRLLTNIRQGLVG